MVKMMRIFLSSVMIISLSAGCARDVSLPVPQEFYRYEEVEGYEFVFREVIGDPQDFYSGGWLTKPRGWDHLEDYERYFNKTGKIHKDRLEYPRSDGTEVWYIATFESNETYYIRADSLKQIEVRNNVYITDSLVEAQNCIGDTIWITNRGGRYEDALQTENEAISYSLDHWEQLIIIGLDTRTFLHHYGTSPFNLIVKKASGEIGYFPYNDSYHTTNNPWTQEY